MTNDDKIREQKIQYNIKYMQKYVQYYQVKFINMKTLQTKKYYFPIKVKLYNKLSLFTLLQVNLKKKKKTIENQV